MYKGMYVAVTGALAAEKRLDTIANNLANMNTPGFKADHLVFESYLKKSEADTRQTANRANANPAYMAQAEYPLISEQYTDFSQGPIRTTGNPLDIALHGEGFLAVMTNDGERYTRSGNLRVGPNSELVTTDGWLVLAQNDQPIYVHDWLVTIDEAGDVWTGENAGKGPPPQGSWPERSFLRHAGRLKLVDFAKPYRLQKQGNGLYLPSVQGETFLPTNLKVVQSHLEGSNVSVIRQMADMIENQRMTETFQKVIRENDQMTTTLILQISRAR